MRETSVLPIAIFFCIAEKEDTDRRMDHAACKAGGGGERTWRNSTQTLKGMDLAKLRKVFV